MRSWEFWETGSRKGGREEWRFTFDRLAFYLNDYPTKLLRACTFDEPMFVITGSGCILSSSSLNKLPFDNQKLGKRLRVNWQYFLMLCSHYLRTDDIFIIILLLRRWRNSSSATPVSRPPFRSSSLNSRRISSAGLETPSPECASTPAAVNHPSCAQMLTARAATRRSMMNAPLPNSKRLRPTSTNMEVSRRTSSARYRRWKMTWLATCWKPVFLWLKGTDLEDFKRSIQK